ncbi:MAG: aminotransferase class IV [Tenacibaculum sp.]
MININGTLVLPDKATLSFQNRAFKYGDGIFETIRVENNRTVFLEDHYFRLMASMRMLRMKIPMAFTLEFLKQQILNTLEKGETKHSVFSARITVYRKDGGRYAPKTNHIDYLIETALVQPCQKKTYTLDLYKEFYSYSGLLSSVKTTNRMLNILASIYAEENNLDNCILLNENKRVAEAINGNIFIVKGSEIKTPALTEGCIRGIIRKKIIEIAVKHPDFSIEETNISPFEIQKADEVFITNAIQGVISVTNYKKKVFQTVVANKLKNSLKLLSITAF